MMVRIITKMVRIITSMVRIVTRMVKIMLIRRVRIVPLSNGWSE